MSKRILHIHVRKIYWLQARDGEKTEEYRQYKKYWLQRLAKEYDEIHYHCGYPKKRDKTKTLIFKWNGFKEGDITHEEFGGTKHCFIIPLSR